MRELQEEETELRNTVERQIADQRNKGGPQVKPNIGFTASLPVQLVHQRVAQWQTGPPIIQTIPPRPDGYEKTNADSHSNREFADGGQSGEQRRYSQIQSTIKDPSFDPSLNRNYQFQKIANYEREQARLRNFMANLTGEGIVQDRRQLNSTFDNLIDYQQQDTRPTISGFGGKFGTEREMQTPTRSGQWTIFPSVRRQTSRILKEMVICIAQVNTPSDLVKSGLMSFQRLHG